MRLTNVIAAATILVLTLLYLWGGYHYPVMNRVGIGPGMFPWSIATLLIVLSALWLINSLRSIPKDRPHPFGTFRVDLQKPVILIILLSAMLALTPYLGFVLAGTAMVFILYYFLEHKPLLKSAALAAIFPAAFYTIFSTMLGVNVPKGILGW
jgi:hypothetical protein